MIFLGDFVKIINKTRYDDEIGKATAYDGFMLYTIELLTTDKYLKALFSILNL